MFVLDDYIFNTIKSARPSRFEKRCGGGFSVRFAHNKKPFKSQREAKQFASLRLLRFAAQPMGFEPTISAVTGRRFKPAKLRLHNF